MKICYIGHRYHLKTASTAFVAKYLEENASSFTRIDTEPSLEHLNSFDMEALAAADYDLIFVFQIEMLAKQIADQKLRARLIFVPMYDGCWRLDDAYWASFVDRSDIRVINFSSTLHTRLGKLGINSYRFQYFPAPKEPKPEEDGPMRVFFWQRVERPSWDAVKTLFSGVDELKFHLHLAGDPLLREAIDAEAEKAVRNITISTWFEDPDEYQRLMSACDIYVAPREYEGIGMSFLEAMAAGKCVVAPDNPTMNEYIVHGVNGLLYDIDTPAPLDLSRVREIGAMARRGIVAGHRRWCWDFETRLHRVLFDPKLPDPAIYQELGSFVRGPGAETFPRASDAAFRGPAVSVAMVCYNCADAVGPTLESILSQTYPALELVVVDGGSTDGTLQLLDSFRPRIDVFVSEKDKGVYDAMNKATRLASGDYIIFINAGDFFDLPTSLEEMMHNVFGAGSGWRLREPLPDFIVGNHVYVHSDGVSALHHAADFDLTWQMLQSGTMTPSWWSGIPCHQATLARRELLEAEEYDLSFRITADHNFMFSMRAKGARFVHSNSLIATYVGGGMSQVQEQICAQESFRVAATNSPHRERVETYYVTLFGPLSIVENPTEYEADAAAIRKSGLFFEEWYRMHYILPRTRIKDPILHFLISGWRENCKPNPFFDPAHYLMRNSDVHDAGLNPFVHYIKYGRETYRPTYDWDCKDQPLSVLKMVYKWYDGDLAELEENLMKAGHNLLKIAKTR